MLPGQNVDQLRCWWGLFGCTGWRPEELSVEGHADKQNAVLNLLLAQALLSLLAGGFHVIVLLPRQKVASIKCAPEDSVWALKEAIYDYYGMYPENQRLIYAGQVLENELKLSDFGIQNGSEVKLVWHDSIKPGNKLVKVKAPQGETIKVQATASTTIDDVKRAVSEKTGLPAADFGLRWQSRYVMGSETLASLCPCSHVVKLYIENNTETKFFNKQSGLHQLTQ